MEVQGDARVTTGAGDDHVLVAFNPNRFQGSLAIDTGAGNDIVYYQPDIFPVSRDLRIQLGSGDDVLGLSLNGVGGDLVLDGGARSDQLWLPNPEGALATVTGTISISNVKETFDADYDYWFE